VISLAATDPSPLQSPQSGAGVGGGATCSALPRLKIELGQLGPTSPYHFPLATMIRSGPVEAEETRSPQLTGLRFRYTDC
jgi:hypothetical protein